MDHKQRVALAELLDRHAWYMATSSNEFTNDEFELAKTEFVKAKSAFIKCEPEGTTVSQRPKPKRLL